MRATAQSFLRQPLSVVFANPANVRVLRELCRYGREMSTTTLVERSRLTKPSVLAALDNLSALGYVESLGSSRQHLYRIDEKHPFATILTTLFVSEERRFESIVKSVRDAAGDAGAIAAWLYGSVARGEDHTASDLDVALVADKDAEIVKAKIREALHSREDTLRFSTSLICSSTEDIKRLAYEKHPWWVEMSKDAVPLIGPPPVLFVSNLSAKERGVE